jgi:hypothetical protein
MGYTARYSKLKSGNFGARILCDEQEDAEGFEAGDKVTVTTKDGERQKRKIERVLWRGLSTFEGEEGKFAVLCALEDDGPPTRKSGVAKGGSRKAISKSRKPESEDDDDFPF